MGDYFLQQVVNALSAGSLYALMAVGLAMVFGILRLINFAHGDLMMIAAYVAVFCIGAGLPLLVSLPIIVLATVIVPIVATPPRPSGLGNAICCGLPAMRVVRSVPFWRIWPTANELSSIATSGAPRIGR